MGLVLIGWVGPKVNRLKLVLVLICWVGPKVNRFDLGSGLGPNRLAQPKVNGLDL